MNKMIEAALSAETILLTDRNREPSLIWLRSIGLDAPDISGRCLTAVAGDKSYVVTSNSSIAPDIQAGYAGFGLMGSDKFTELEDVDSLSFEPVGKLACRFVLAVPQNGGVPSNTLRVATSYPREFGRFVSENGIEACLGPVRPGKVEGTIAQGIADAVFDISDTGETLRANNLTVIAEGENVELGGVWRI